jgi:mannose-1-phosphate guanylyltransferase
MKAMILAAGKGTRVRPLTYELPKPMIPILGKPVMAYLIEHLARYGVTEIMVNVSYLHEKIEEYFGEGHQFGVQIGYSFEGYTNDDGEVVPEPIGSAGGIKKIQEFGGFFDETTIVLCGDALIDLDLKSALFEHRRKGALATVITREVPWDKVSSYGVVVSDDNGRIRLPGKARQQEACSNCASTGIYIFEPEVIDLIPSGRPFDIGSELFPLLAERGLPFYSQTRKFDWIDIGSVKDYWEVLQAVLLGDVANMEVPGVQVEEGVWVGLNTSIDWNHGTKIEGPVYIGSGVPHRPRRPYRRADLDRPRQPYLHGRKGGAQRLVRIYSCVTGCYARGIMIVLKDYSVDRSGEMKHVSSTNRTNGPTRATAAPAAARRKAMAAKPNSPK